MGEVGWTIKTHQRRIPLSPCLAFCGGSHPDGGPCRSKAHGLLTKSSSAANRLPPFSSQASLHQLNGRLYREVCWNPPQHHGLGSDLLGHRRRMSSGLLRQLVLPWARSGGELEHGRQRLAARGGWITSACWDDVHAYLLLNN
jgi:hypothetical protein